MVGGPCDFSVSPSPFDLDFGLWDFGLGLDNNQRQNFQAPVQVPFLVHSKSFPLILIETRCYFWLRHELKWWKSLSVCLSVMVIVCLEL